jgi:hypothetical protein
MKLHRIHIAKLIFACIVLDILFPAYTFATPSHYQQCASGDTCVVGEFVFDDTYAPVSDAQCTLKSRYPDGTIFVNTQPMTPGSDGCMQTAVRALLSIFFSAPMAALSFLGIRGSELFQGAENRTRST